MSISSDFIEKTNYIRTDARMLDACGSTSLAYKTIIKGQTCFIKKLRPEFCKEERYRTLFYKEYYTGKKVDSPYIIRYLDLVDDMDELAIITEYVNGCTLKEKVEKEPEYFAHKENLDKLLIQLCEALKALHKENVAYLDINPGNIIISQISNNVKLIDLGFCLSDWNDCTAGNTPCFAAPEAIKNDKGAIDSRSDIYSIGALLQYIEEKTGAKLPKYIKRIKIDCLHIEKSQRKQSADEIILEIAEMNRKRNRWKQIATAALLIPLIILLYNVTNYIAWENGMFADKFEKDGIFYLITDHKARTVEVTFKGNSFDEYNSEYNDINITIPPTVTHCGRKFRVTSIGTMAFDNPETTSITIPEGVETIKEKAFWDCRITGNVYIPNSIKEIGSMVYQGNVYIDSITVGSKNTVYDSRNGCNAIIETATNTLVAACKNTVIPYDVTAIGDDAYMLYSKESIFIPQNVRSIGKYAFFRSALKEIALPYNLTSIKENAFLNCAMLQRVDLPENLKEIEAGAFWMCGLQEISIPDKVTVIGNKAFAENKNLQYVTIGSSVQDLGGYAFENCENLIKVFSRIPAKELKPTGSGCFNGINKDCILYVPKGSASIYRECHGWNCFARIIETDM